MEDNSNADLLDLLRQAEEAAWRAAGPMPEDGGQTHRLIALALKRAEELLRPGTCARLDCPNVVTYSGRGRRSRYCNRACRDWDRQRKTRQQRRDQQQEHERGCYEIR